MKHNYFNLNQNASKNDGQVPRNVQMSRYCPQPDSVSNPCRCRDLATPRVFSAVLSARAWKHVAMIFAVLVMSMANVGVAWGATGDLTSPYTLTFDNTTGGISETMASGKSVSTDAAGAKATGDAIKATWTLSLADNGTALAKNSNGLKVGNSSSTNVYDATFSSSSFSSFTITQIDVKVKNNSSNNSGNVMTTTTTVTVGGEAFDEAKSITNTTTATVLTFKPATGKSGNITINIANTGAYINHYYVQSIKVTFTAGGGGGGGDECSSPSFTTQPTSADYTVGASATSLTSTATATNSGDITYKWQKSTDYGNNYSDIDGATNQTYSPSTATAGITYYRSVAMFSGGCSNTNSNAAIVAVSGGNSGTMSGSDYIRFKNKTGSNTATSATTSNSTALTSLSGQLTGDGSGNKTAKVTASTGQTYSFTVASGYTFDPTYIGFMGSYVGSGAPTQMTFTYALKNSSSETLCSGTFVQATHDNTAPLDTIYKGSIDITPLEAGTYTLKITGSQDKNVANNFRLGNWVTIKGTVASSCSAPNHVDVSGNYRFTPGETISLTATAYSSAGTNDPITSGVTYQWQKYNGSTWDDLTNTGNISGATSANLQISSCTTSNGGSYRCKASTGSGCDKYSDDGKDAHFIRIWTFNGNYNDDSFIANNITWTGATTGTVTLTLNANSTYKFKVFDNDGKWFGCNSGISSDATNWTFRTNEGNCSLTTGKVAGEYTFTIDIASAGDNNITVSVAYPMMRIYMECGSNGWCNDNPVFFAHSWKGGTSHNAMMTAHPCESGLYYADIPSYDTDLKFTRQKPGSTEIAWSGTNFWNQSGNITIGSNNKFTNTGWNTTPEPDEGNFSGSSYSPTTYTITFANGGGTGSMSAIGSIACGANQALTANSFEKTGHTFSCWHANVDVKVGGATVTAGNAIANSATIQDISSNITLTAQWTPNNYDLTWDLAGGSTTSAGTGIASGVSSNTTSSIAFGTSLSAPTVTKTGYNFSSWSPSVASTMPAANTTYTAQWTAKTTTITINANTANHGSTAPSPITATYGSALPSFTAAAGVSGWNLTGYFTEATSGTKVINANGTLVASTDYADGSGNWKYESATLTLYAQYEEAEAGCIDANSTNFGAGNSDGGASKTLDDGTVVAMNKCTNSASSVSIGGNILFTAPTGKAFETFSFVATCGSAGKTNYYKINGGSQQNLESSTTTSKRYTITVPASPNTTTIQIIKNGTTPAVTEFCYTYKDVCTTPATAFANGAYTVGGAALDLSTLISGKQGSGAITYTVKNANGTGATIAGSNFTATSAGTATVTATQAANGDYCEKVMDATITVSAADGCPAAASGEVVYKFVTKSSGLGTSAICANKDQDYPLSTGDGNPLETLTNGTLTARASSAGTTNLKYNTSSINFNGGNSGWLIVGLDCPIKSGDVIRYVNNNSGSVAIRTAKGTDANQIVLAGNSTTEVQTVVITSAQATAFNELTTVYMVRKSGTSDISYFEIIRPYVVTLDANTNGGKVNGENTETHYVLSGESFVLPHATKSGYRFKGWFTTSDGATQASTNYSPTGTTTLYAQFEDCPGSGTVYKWEVKSGLENGSLPVGVSGEAEMDANEGNYLSTLIGGTLTLHNKNNHIKISDNSKFSIDDNAPYIIVNLDCALEAGDKFVATVGSHTAYVTAGSGDRSSAAKRAELPTGTKQETAVPAALEGASTLYIWRGNGDCKISYFEITRTSTTYTVSYDANGGSGTAPTDGTAYARNTEVTVKDNTGSLTKSNYAALAYWNTANDGTGTDYAISTGTFEITADVTLYAKWTQAVTFDANTANHGSAGGSATAVWNATGLTGITHATPASGYKLLGYYTTASGDGVKVLNSDGTFASSNVTDYITSGKWSRTDEAPTLYARYESSGALIWNLGVNTDATSLTTSSKNSEFAQIAGSNMTNAALTGISYSKSKKSELTGIIETPTSYDGAKYVSVTFQVAAGYKFTPSSVKVKVQPKDNAKTVKLELSDASSHSQSYISGSQEAGSIHTVTMTGNGTFYIGTVTLKIYCYGASEGYRLGTPITIEGEVEATCAMPSFDGLNYEQTSYSLEDDASAITVTNPANVTTYAWKQNTTNDRTGTTPAAGTNNEQSYTPTISSEGTMYYWCELTNACGTVKTPAVGITVSSSKSDATISWTGTSASANYGGGGYTVKATVNETGWKGNAADLTLSAPAGIRIYNIESGETASQKWVRASFDVTTAFDRETYSSTIPFVVTADATASYNAISDEHAVSYEACTGAGEGESYNIRMRKVVTKDGNYYHCANTDGWISANINSSHSTTKASSTMETVFDTVASSNTQYVWVRTYHADINKVRIYADFRADNMTVTNVYKNTGYFSADSKYAVDYTAIYNGSEGNEDLGSAAQGYVDIELDNVLEANDVLLVAFSTNRVRPLGAVITEGSAGSLTTTLTWSGGIADGGTVSGKTQSSANFTYTASKTGANNNSLGAITYTSSNTSCATVNATTGEVTITASGASDLSTTITATLAASGCYKQKSITYSFTIPGVTCTINHGTLSSDITSKCETENATLTLSDFESGATLQWYKGESTISDGATYDISDDGTTLVTKEAGTYSVMVTNATCSDRSNSITISNKSTSVHVTRLVKEWYIKNGRLTPDIALWELGEDCSFVGVTASDGWDAGTGLTEAELGEKVFYEKDGIVYLKGTEPKANAGAVQNYTLTLTVDDGCSEPTLSTADKQITIHHQQNTDKHVLAFVVNGTEKGDWTAGVTAAQTTNVGLYNAIAAQFDVQATNIYATDDEKKLKEYYSQYDILCITDYPNTQTKGANSKSYVDAIGSLIDIRPILTMEAFVSKLANWKAKGISGNPKSPTTRQYTMDLQCKDHEIFAGTELTKVGEGDEAMYRVSMVDNTKEDYATLDATYGATLPHKEKESKKGAGDGEYNYGGKPALQGFTFTQEMSDNDLLPIGLIDDGAGNPLQVGIERQHNMEARLMVLGINSYAMERLTDDGERVVINALNYLMKKNAEDIADCSTSFVGGAEGDAKNWNNANNWTGNTVPLPSQKVRILADCEVSSTVYALDVLIVTGGKYNHGSDNAEGKLTIKENGALIVGGKIQAASAPAYNRTRATTPDKLLIETSDEHQAALIFDNEEAETQATVHLYSLGCRPSSYQYQYFAVPMEVVPVNPAFANETHGGTGIYTYVYNEATSGWTRRKYYDDLFAFEGLGITTKSTGAMNYTMTGNLASTATKEITLTHNGAGLNLIGNSWMAPIQIGALAEDNTDANITKTVYIYCAGRDAEGGAVVSSDDTETAGQWLAIPFEAAEFETWKATGKLSVIPAMQAFQIKTAAEATLTLDYDKVVRGSTNDLNAKLRAPGRPMAANEVTMTNIRVADSKTHTDLSLFEGDRFSEAFDNGWEAEYMNGDGRSAKLYAETETGKMAVAAMYDYEGTVVGFAPGKETEYTFSFMGEDNGYYLNDIKLQNSVRISEGETYTFTYEEGDAANRFYISRTAINAPEVATGMENLDAAAPKVQKIIYNDKLYIIRGGRLYDATGKVVK